MRSIDGGAPDRYAKLLHRRRIIHVVCLQNCSYRRKYVSCTQILIRSSRNVGKSRLPSFYSMYEQQQGEIFIDVLFSHSTIYLLLLYVYITRVHLDLPVYYLHMCVRVGRSFWQAQVHAEYNVYIRKFYLIQSEDGEKMVCERV